MDTTSQIGRAHQFRVALSLSLSLSFYLCLSFYLRLKATRFFRVRRALLDQHADFCLATCCRLDALALATFDSGSADDHDADYEDSFGALYEGKSEQQQQQQQQVQQVRGLSIARARSQHRPIDGRASA